MSNYENAEDYLNKILDPTSEDFYNFFRILQLTLQKEALNNRWNCIKANNFHLYDNNHFSSYETGIELILVKDGISQIRLGVKFEVKDSKGYFYIFSQTFDSIENNEHK